jgi:hypothetical protein
VKAMIPRVICIQPTGQLGVYSVTSRQSTTAEPNRRTHRSERVLQCPSAHVSCNARQPAMPVEKNCI